MLINISNHPVSGVFDASSGAYINGWSEEQLHAAETEFGGVQDLAFPDIPAEASFDGVRVIAQDYLLKCLECLSMYDEPNAVLLMGELVFCSLLSGMLLERGIRVVCTTTRRTSEELGNGRSVKVYKFVAFRDYGIPNDNSPL